MKYSKEIEDKIIELYESGDHTIQQICAAVGISRECWYKWKDMQDGFKERLESCEPKRLEKIKELARSGLAKLLDTYEYDEETTEYIDDPINPGTPIIKSKKVTTKRVMPNPTAVIFALTNQDSENFKHKQEIQHSGDLSITWNEEKTYDK